MVVGRVKRPLRFWEALDSLGRPVRIGSNARCYLNRDCARWAFAAGRAGNRSSTIRDLMRVPCMTLT